MEITFLMVWWKDLLLTQTWKVLQTMIFCKHSMNQNFYVFAKTNQKALSHIKLIRSTYWSNLPKIVALEDHQCSHKIQLFHVHAIFLVRVWILTGIGNLKSPKNCFFWNLIFNMSFQKFGQNILWCLPSNYKLGLCTKEIKLDYLQSTVVKNEKNIFNLGGTVRIYCDQFTLVLNCRAFHYACIL